jgi:hypothetical protein
VCADGYGSSLAAATLRDLRFVRATDRRASTAVASGFPVDRHTDEAAGASG